MEDRLFSLLETKSKPPPKPKKKPPQPPRTETAVPSEVDASDTEDSDTESIPPRVELPPNDSSTITSLLSSTTSSFLLSLLEPLPIYSIYLLLTYVSLRVLAWFLPYFFRFLRYSLTLLEKALLWIIRLGRWGVKWTFWLGLWGTGIIVLAATWFRYGEPMWVQWREGLGKGKRRATHLDRLGVDHEQDERRKKKKKKKDRKGKGKEKES